MSEITNPYRTGEPVADVSMLFGRQDAADWLELQLTNNVRASVLVGQPLVGKTSFIAHVGTLQHLNSYNLRAALPTPTDFRQVTPKQKAHRSELAQERAASDTILRQLVEQLLPQLRQLNLITSDPIDTSMPITTFLHNMFSQAQQQAGSAKLVFYLDDLHHLVTNDLALVSTFLSTFIPLLDTCPSLHLVFTINQDKLKQIRHPLLDGAPAFQLGPLSADASANMITQPVRNMLRFDYGIPRRIAEVNSHHPYYLCLFCHTLLNRQIHDGWVNQRDFDSALGELLNSPIAPFEQIWEQSSWVERAVLAGMAAMQGKHGPMTQQEITRFLQRENESIDSGVVVDALQSLAGRGVLVPMGAVSYRFHVELFRFWLREHTDFTEILPQADWNRLASQKAKEKKQAAPTYTPPATTPQKRASKGRLLGRIMILLAALACLLAACGAFGVRYLGLDLPVALLFTTPTATPTATPENQPAAPGADTAEASPTTAPVEPTPTVTPTPALFVAQTLPAITYMGREPDQSWRIYVMEANGNSVKALSPEGLDDTAPTWSPDGRKIAFVSQRDGNREIYVMDAWCDNPEGCSQDAANITRHPADDWTPAWSLDGTQLAFSSLREGSWEIFVLDTACLDLPDTCRDSLQQVTADGNLNISPVWSPDGSRFAFNSKASGNWDIYTMNTDGSAIQQITTAPGNDLSPAWSPDGTKIAYEANQEGNVEIYVIDANGTTPPQNISNYSTANDHGPTWSPDGQMLVFYSNRENIQWDIFSTTLDGEIVNNLTQTPDRDEQTPAWRP